jgi:hypothetical protein
MDRTYWAAAQPEELPSRLQEKVEDYYNTLRTNGKLELWKRAYRHHYGLDEQGRHIAAKPYRDGRSGELIRLKAAHYRNLSQHLINLTTQSRPSFEARAKTTDYKAITSCILGQQILDSDMREDQLEQLFRLATELAVALCAEAYVETDWNYDAGEDYAVDPASGRVIRSGRPESRVYHAVDIIREYYQDEDGKADWLVTRRFVSRHRLAALHPDHADKILSMAEDGPSSSSGDDIDDIGIEVSSSGSDRLRMYKVWHDRCPHMADGLRAVVVGDLVLEHGPLPKKIRKLPVRRLCPGQQVKTPYGYTSAYDLMAINDVIDMLYSTLTSNNNAGGLNIVWTPPGSGLKVSDLGDGLRHAESTTEPKAIALVNSPPEAYRFLEMLERLCETISGVNSVARGNPEGELKGASGSAMALLQSMTIQFASGLQASYAQLVEGVGDDRISAYKAYATIPQVATIVGKHNRSYAKEFVGEELDPIEKIIVDMGNPAARTAAGRLQIADNLMAQGMIQSPEKYLEVLSTGKLEPIVENTQTRRLLIRAENEALKEGGQVQAMISDPHHEHVPEHLSILDDPEARKQPAIVQSVLAHVQEHLDMWPSVPPAMAMLLNMPQPPMPPMMPPQGGPGAPPPPAGEQAPGPAPEGPQPTAGPMPSMPTNPMTGEQAPAPQGAA